MKKVDYIGTVDSESLYYIQRPNYLDIITQKKTLFKIDYLSILSQNEMDLSFHLLSIVLFENKLYYLIYAYKANQLIIKSSIYDISLKKQYEILMPPDLYQDISNKISLNQYTTVFEKNKIFFIGGVQQNNKNTQKEIFAFDIGTYTLAKEKFSEFSLIPRFRAGATSQNGIIYVVGGYTSISAKDENITDEVQFAKYDDDQLHKFTIAKIDGEKPLLMLDPNVKIIKDRYVVAFSGYKYCKIWIMDTKDNKGKNYDLRKYKVDECNQENKKYFFLNECEFISETRAAVRLDVIDISDDNYSFELVERNIDL